MVGPSLKCIKGAAIVSAMDTLVFEDGQAWREDHQEDHYDAEQDEGARP